MLVEDKYDRWERGMGIEKKGAGLKTTTPPSDYETAPSDNPGWGEGTLCQEV